MFIYIFLSIYRLVITPNRPHTHALTIPRLTLFRYLPDTAPKQIQTTATKNNINGTQKFTAPSTQAAIDSENEPSSGAGDPPSPLKQLNSPIFHLLCIFTIFFVKC